MLALFWIAVAILFIDVMVVHGGSKYRGEE